MNNEFLNKKLSQLVNDKTQVIKATKNYSKGQVVSFSGQVFITQHEVRKGSDLLLTEEGHAIALNFGSVDQSRVLSSTTLTSRSGSPRPRARGSRVYNNFFGISPFTRAFPDTAILFNNRYPNIVLPIRGADENQIANSHIWINNGKLYSVIFSSNYDGSNGFYYSFVGSTQNGQLNHLTFPLLYDEGSILATNSSILSFPSKFKDEDEDEDLTSPGFIFDLETGNFEKLNFNISHDKGDRFSVICDVTEGSDIIKASTPNHGVQVDYIVSSGSGIFTPARVLSVDGVDIELSRTSFATHRETSVVFDPLSSPDRRDSFTMEGILPTDISGRLPELPFSITSNKGYQYDEEEIPNINQNHSTSASYKLPILVNTKDKKFICTSFTGNMSYTVGDSANGRMTTMTSTPSEENTYLYSNNDYLPVVGKTSYMIHMSEEATGDISVGSTISETFSLDFSRITDNETEVRKSQYMYLPGNLLKVDRRRLEDDSIVNNLRGNYLIDSTPINGVLEELNTLSLPGSKIYGAIRKYNNQTSSSNYDIVIFKGTLNSLNYQLVSKGEQINPNLFYLTSAKIYCPLAITGYNFTIDSIVRDYPVSDFNLEFNEQWFPTFAYFVNSGRRLGKFFLDGSFANMFSSYYYTGPSSLGAASLIRSYEDLTKSDFLKYFTGNKWIWKDPFIYRVTMEYGVTTTGEYALDDREVSFFRWKINYSTSPIRFEFDGIENFNLREVNSDIISSIDRNNLSACTDATF